MKSVGNVAELPGPEESPLLQITLKEWKAVLEKADI